MSDPLVHTAPKAPRSVNLNVLKVVAIVSMVIDHVHFIGFYRQWSLVTVMGLAAFPLFCFLLTYNYLFHSRNRTRYIARLCAFFIVSQWPYQWAFERATFPLHLNIFASLAAGLLIIHFFESVRFKGHRVALWVVTTFGLVFEYVSGEAYLRFLDGGFSGLLLMPAFFFLFQRHRLVSLSGAVMVAFALWILDDSNCGWSIGTVAFAYYLSGFIPLELGWMRRAKWFFYVFYPAHLLLIRAVFLWFR